MPARIMPAQFVRPFIKSNKNDFNDAQAIAEAVSLATMRFVPVKNTEQLDLQALHRARDRFVHDRTVNQLSTLTRSTTCNSKTSHADQRRNNLLIYSQASAN
jgi:transposase